MTEFWITLTITVDAQDTEQALEIARDMCKAAKTGTNWKVREAEVVEVENTGVGL